MMNLISGSWIESFTSNFFADILVAVAIGIFLYKWIEKREKWQERKENNKIIANLIAAELKFNKEQLPKLIQETPKGNLVFPALDTSAWDIIDKAEFLSFFKPENTADILKIYRRVRSINKMYDDLLENSNWAATGRVTIVRREFLDAFIDRCKELSQYLDDFFAEIELRKKIKESGKK